MLGAVSGVTCVQFHHIYDIIPCPDFYATRIIMKVFDMGTNYYTSRESYQKSLKSNSIPGIGEKPSTLTQE